MDYQCPRVPEGPAFSRTNRTLGQYGGQAWLRSQNFRIGLSGDFWIPKTDNCTRLVLTPEVVRTEVPRGRFLPHPRCSLCSQSSSPVAGPGLSQNLSDPICWAGGRSGWRRHSCPDPALTASSGTLEARVRMTWPFPRRGGDRINHNSNPHDLAIAPGKHP